MPGNRRDGSTAGAQTQRELRARGDDLHAETTPAPLGTEAQSDVTQALERGRQSDATAGDLITRLTLPPGTGFTRKGHHRRAGEELIEPRVSSRPRIDRAQPGRVDRA